MKKTTEKPPIDDLFARKLGNMSLSPSPDGFERLQARMGQKKPEANVVFWRNPATYGYVAAAACVAVVFLFGWQYWPSGNTTRTDKNEVAITSSGQQRSEKNAQEPTKPQTEQQIPQKIDSNQNIADQAIEEDRVAAITKGPAHRRFDSSEKQSKTIHDLTSKNPGVTTDLPTVAQVTQETKTPDVAPIAPLATPTTTIEQPVVVVNKPSHPSERVLEVTIAEPEALVAARQIAKASTEEKPVVASSDKHEKETKAGNLWQQVKRFKQGEVFARGENTDNERSLLGRAYNGLRHTLDKDKAAKQ